MKKYFGFIFIALLLMQCVCFAEGDYFGTVYFPEGDNPADGATARLLDTAKTQKYHSVSDKKGKFSFSGVKNGKYVLYITYVGYKPIEFGFTITDKSKKNLGNYELESMELTTDIVNVVADAILGEMVGDTVQYNAGAFKLDSNAKAAELINKIPGIEVDASGNVTAQGKKVEQVLVDGRKFFGDDPKVALENVPAKSVDKVQVYEKASDQDEFIGNDADKENKAINLMLKEEAKRSLFGNVTLGGGTRDRYECNFFTNLMNDKTRIALLGVLNNTNSTGFDMSSLFMNGGGSLAVNLMDTQMSDDGAFFDFSGNSFDSFGGNGAITKNGGTGFSWSDDLWIFKEASITYFFKSKDLTDKSTNRKEFLPVSETSEVSNSEARNDDDSYSHSFSVSSSKVDISKNNSLRFSVLGSYDKPTYDRVSTSISNYQNGANVSDANTQSTSDMSSKNASVYLTYAHKFDKPGRSFGVNYGMTYSESEGDETQNSLINYYLTGNADTINQLKDKFNKNAYNNISASVTEKFGEYSKVSLDYYLRLTNTQNNIASYDLLHARSLDTAYSSLYHNVSTEHSAEVAYRFKKGKISLDGGVEYTNRQLDGESVLPYLYHVDYAADKFLPFLMFIYYLQDESDWGNNFQFDYTTSMHTPSVTQLQEFVDNSNPLWISVGNSNLKVETTKVFSLGGNITSGNFKDQFWFSLDFTETKNPICNNSFTAMTDTVINGITLVPGSHLSRLVNLDKSRELHGIVSISQPFALLTGATWSSNLQANYTDKPLIINDVVYKGKDLSVSFGLGLSTTFSQKFQFDID